MKTSRQQTTTIFTATTLAAVLLGSLVALPTTAVAAPTPTREQTAAHPDGHGGEPAATDRSIGFGAPQGVRVVTDEVGFTVYGTPVCSGYNSCRSWFQVPAMGVDAKGVATSNGYFIRWPSSWAEGQTVSGATIASYGWDLFGNGWFGGVTSVANITRPVTARNITARLLSQDDSARRATITGTATPGASIRRDGVVVATADPAGSWTATVNGLPVGTTSLVFQQYVGTAYRDQATVSVQFSARDLVVGVGGETTVLAPGSDTVVYGNLRATGTVTAPLSGARVVFTAPTGTTFLPGTRSIRGQFRPASGGDWQDFASEDLVNGSVSADGRTATFVWAPPTGSGWTLQNGTALRFGIAVDTRGAAAGSGELRMTASGSAPQGSFSTAATTPVRIEAGALAPVTVTGPATVLPGTENRFTGTATPGASFQVVNGSGTVIVAGGPFTVGPDGRWTFDRVVSRGATEFRFAIQQTAYGTTETSDVFTIAADTLRQVEVETASARAGVSNEFSGTATPRASYRVLNVSGTEIVNGGPFTVDPSGSWRFDRVVSTGAAEFRFRIEQRLDGKTTTSELFTVPVV